LNISRTWKLALGVYLACLAAYLSTAGGRLRGHSSDTHFSYLADMWLHRHLDLGHPPPNQNDWAEVDYLHLKDGRTVAGTYLRAQPQKFRKLEGSTESIPNEQIANRWKKYYVSFPPFPAILFLPFVAVWGLAFNDVLFTALLAALGPMLLFVSLRRLSERGDTNRAVDDDLWLTAMFAFGTVWFYSSVQGQVWYTAHVVSVVLVGLFVLASLEAAHPIWAGLMLGCLVLTRPQMGFWGVFYLYELWRAKKPPVVELVKVGVPVVLLGAVGAWFNWVRFHSFFEFGHFYLNVRWTDRIQRYGLFNYSFLSRNLAAAFTLTPKLLPHAPWIQVPWHGLSMLITTPALGYLLWPRNRSTLHAALWITVAPIALMSLLYQNDGWVQFGFRFSIDYLFALILLLAVGNRPLTRTFKALIVAGIAVNLFGAITFGRMWQLYFDGFFPIGPAEY
jgi:hypothetical protein